RLWQAGARGRHSPAAVAGVGRALPRRAPPRKGLRATAMAERAPGVVSRAPQGAAQRAAGLAEDQKENPPLCGRRGRDRTRPVAPPVGGPQPRERGPPPRLRGPPLPQHHVVPPLLPPPAAR